jgi:hypothetical protein
MPSEFYINNMTSTIQTVDSEALLSPELTRRIVAIVLEELERKQAFNIRRESDRRLDSGAVRHRQGETRPS